MGALSQLTAADVAARWAGAVTPAVNARIGAMIEDSETLLARRISGLAARLADGRTNPGMLKLVIIQAIIRVLNNPAGVQGEHRGEAGYYFALTADDLPPGQLGFSAADLASLGVSRTRAGLGNVETPLAPWQAAPRPTGEMGWVP